MDLFRYSLAAKLSRISNPGYPHYARYSKTCEAVVGFLVTAIPSDSGQLPGAYLPSGETLPIEQMGEGVPNIVALLADLAGASDKLFLIEEPENDLHPTALKALLDLIVESSQSNQFVVSTHSNIVLRHLGAAKHSRVYEVTSSSLSLPITSEIRAVDTTPEARLHVLQQLGYSLSDFDLWDGWIFLEEASAERIIRDYLIPWFAPKLKRVRTMSAGGVGKLEPAFEDFHRLTRFTHLENAYSGSTWVRADGDTVGQELIERLRSAYTTWPHDRFGFFSKPSFELYYPAVFKERIQAILAISDRQRKRVEKRGLLGEVVEWLDADHERAKSALAESAKEIIDDLRRIESQLIARTSAARQP